MEVSTILEWYQYVQKELVPEIHLIIEKVDALEDAENELFMMLENEKERDIDRHFKHIYDDLSIAVSTGLISEEEMKLLRDFASLLHEMAIRGESIEDSENYDNAYRSFLNIINQRKYAVAIYRTCRYKLCKELEYLKGVIGD